MLYFSQIEINPGKTLRVVILAKANVDGQVMYFNVKPLLGNDKVIPTLSQFGDRILVDSADKSAGAKEPILVYPVIPDSDSPAGSLDSTIVYKLFSTNPTLDNYAAIAARLNNPHFTEEDVKQFKIGFDSLQHYINGEDLFKVVVPELHFANVARTMSVVRDHNGRLGHQFEFINAEINKTNFMTSETDQFFIEIPDYDKLRGMDQSIVSMLPDVQDIAEPYPHPIYRTPFATRFLSQTPSELRQTLVKVSGMVKLTREQMDDVPRIDLRFIEGSSVNNDLDIQANELEYRNALEEMIRYDISQTYPKEDVDSYYNNCTCSPRMMEYLTLLLETIAKMNWSHTNKFPIAYDMGAEEEDDDNESNGEAESKMFWDMGEGIEDGLLILNSFIDTASKQGLGFNAYIEAIIKLARWGSVKPSILKLGNYNRYLDLNTFYIRSTTGNVSTMKPILIDGYELQLTSLVIFDDKFRDVDYKNKIGVSTSKVVIPVGFECERHYSDGLSQTVFMSVIDVVSKYKEDPSTKFIKGVHFDGTSFKVVLPESVSKETISLRLANEKVTSDLDKLFVYHTSDGVKQLVLYVGCPSISNLSILYEFLHAQNNLTRWYDSLRFSSKEELTHKISQNPLGIDVYTKTNLANLLVPIVLKATQAYDSSFEGTYDVAEILNLYATTMESVGFHTEGQFITEIGSKYQTQQVQEPPMQDVVNKLQNMNSFGATSPGATPTAPANQPTVQPVISVSEELNSDTAEAMKSFFIAPIQAGERIVSIMDGNEVVGGFVTRGTTAQDTVYVIGDASVVPPGTPASTNTVKSILMLVVDAQYNMLLGNFGKIRVRYHSIDTLKHYRKLLNDQVKREATK